MDTLDTMNPDDLIEILKEASTRLCKADDRCGNLIYVQKEKGVIIREPEARHAISLELIKRNFDFGIEVPTKEKYLFSGKKKNIRCGRIDLVINPEGNQINVELKEGQPKIEMIQKDFEKLLRENVSGASFYHVLKNTNSRSLSTLLEKYTKAYTNAIEKTKSNQFQTFAKWFVLYIFVKEKKRCHWKFFNDIKDVGDVDFDLDEFSQGDLRSTPKI